MMKSHRIAIASLVLCWTPFTLSRDRQSPDWPLIASLVLCWTPFTLTTAWAESPAPLTSNAGRGDAEAQFQLARAHLNGKGVAKDSGKAFEWMMKAAEQGHAEALGGVGYFYANGVAVEKDEARAVEWFRKGAEKGGPRSQFNLGRMLVDGKGAAKDEEKGREWMRKSADQGVTEAIFALGKMYYSGEFGVAKDLERAYPLLRQAAEQGHLDAQNMIGVMLCDGLGVQRDQAEGMKWYRKAALEGHVKAQSNLGRMLGPTNRRPEKDPAERIEALSWLMVAAKQGDVMATKVMEDALPSADEKELSEARKKAAEIRNTLNSQAATRKLFPAKQIPSSNKSESGDERSAD